MNTMSITTGDVNGDGMVDIILGNSGYYGGENNQLLVNNGDGTFTTAVDLRDGAMGTSSIAAADVNGDGMVDIIVGNYQQNNQLLIQ